MKIAIPDMAPNIEEFLCSSKSWRFAGNELTYILEVLRNGFAAGADGSMNERVERAFSKEMGLPYMIALNSGTGTLHTALAAFGVRPGDEVLVPVMTPAMCGFAICYLGATPVFVDMCWDTFLMDPDDLETKITSKTKAIMVVHLFGQVCDMERIMQIAKKYNLRVLEDCAQCFLGTDAQGRIGGTLGDAASWSFENSKHLSSGEGGFAACKDEKLALTIRKFSGLGYLNLTALSGKVRIAREKFQDPEWKRHDIVGYNYRMSDLTAAVALAQVERLREFVSLRQAMGNAYQALLAKSSLLVPETTPAGAVHSYYTFAARFDGLDRGIAWQDFRRKHVENGGDGIYAAWMLMSKEPAFANAGIGRGAVPTAEKLQKRLMLFTTNQKDEAERKRQIDALQKTLRYFGDNA